MREEVKLLEHHTRFLANQALVNFRIVNLQAIDNQIAGGDFFLVASVDGSVERFERDETTVEMAVTNAVAIVPVSAEIDLGGDPRDRAVFRVGGDLTEILWTAADAAGIQMPTSLGGLDAPSPPSLGADEGSASSTRYYDLTVEPRGVIGVLRLDPTTKLEGW